MEVVAVISILSVLAWFVLGVSKSVNINNFTEDELKNK